MKISYREKLSKKETKKGMSMTSRSRWTRQQFGVGSEESKKKSEETAKKLIILAASQEKRGWPREEEKRGKRVGTSKHIDTAGPKKRISQGNASTIGP